MRARVTRCREPISEHMSRATSVALRCQVVFSGFPEHLSVTGDLGSTLTLPGHLADVRLGCTSDGRVRAPTHSVTSYRMPSIYRRSSRIVLSLLLADSYLDERG